MASKKILVPYNFTMDDQKALNFVVNNFVGDKDVEITLLNFYTPAPEIHVTGSPIMEKMRSNVTYLSKKIDDHKEELKAVKQELVRSGLSEDQVSCVFEPRKKDVGRDIVDLCLKGRFNVIVLSRKHEKISRFFTGSVYNKVVSSLKDVTVCIIT